MTPQLASAPLVLFALPNVASVVRMVTVGPLPREARARSAVGLRRLSLGLVAKAGPGACVERFPVQALSRRLVAPFLHSVPFLVLCFGSALQVRNRTARLVLFVALGIVFGVMLRK